MTLITQIIIKYFNLFLNQILINVMIKKIREIRGFYSFKL
jgi:hypothetical protein